MASQAEMGYTPGSYPSSSAGQTAEDWQNRARSEVSRAVDDNPAGTLMTAFGVGLGVGALIGLSIALSTASRPTPKSRAEDFGHRMLEALNDYLPDSVSRRLS